MKDILCERRFYINIILDQKVHPSKKSRKNDNCLISGFFTQISSMLEILLAILEARSL